MALPSNVNFGTVVGQFLLAYADSDDAGPEPDGEPAKGSIFFRPSPIKLLNASATPNPVTVLPAVVECLLDTEGYLLGYPGDRGVRLVATDDPDMNPTGWTWTVEFRLTDQDDVPVSLPSFSIELPSDTTVDLTTVSPVADANGVFYLVGPQGIQGETGPEGPQGIQGEVGPQGPAGSLDNLNVEAPITYDVSTSTVGFDHDAIQFVDGGSA